MQRVVRIDSELLLGDENGTACSERQVAASVLYCSGGNSCRGIVSGACSDNNVPSDTKFFRQLLPDRSDRFIALEKLWQLPFTDAAQLAHLIRPASVFYIQKQHPRCVRHIGGMHSCHSPGYIVLRQHYPVDTRKEFRLILLHPYEFRRGESGECHVGCICGNNLLSDSVVQVIARLRASAIIP